jgi:hypothetical protein
MSHFLPFGQHGYVTNTHPTKPTLAPRARLSRYLDAHSPAVYTILYPDTGQVSTGRSQEFSPTDAPTPRLQPALNTHPVRALHTHTTPIRAPKSLSAIRHLPDALRWAKAHDDEIHRHETALKTWRYEDPLPSDRPRPFIMTYKLKADADQEQVKHKARCAIRGDLMEAGVEYDPLRTSSNTPCSNTKT